MTPNNNTCTVCGLDSSSFIDKRSFRNHVDKHLGVEFKCPPGAKLDKKKDFLIVL